MATSFVLRPRSYKQTQSGDRYLANRCYYIREVTRENGKRLEYRDTNLVSRKAGVALPARVLHAGFSDETWSVWIGETSLNNAKQERRSRLACGAWHIIAATKETVYITREDGCVYRYTERWELTTLLVLRTRSSQAYRLRDAGEEKWYRLDSLPSNIYLKSKQRFTWAGKVLARPDSWIRWMKTRLVV